MGWANCLEINMIDFMRDPALCPRVGALAHSEGAWVVGWSGWWRLAGWLTGWLAVEQADWRLVPGWLAVELAARWLAGWPNGWEAFWLAGRPLE